jgi:hypothetical protein
MLKSNDTSTKIEVIDIEDLFQTEVHTLKRMKEKRLIKVHR